MGSLVSVSVLKQVLRDSGTIAVVGLSPKDSRPSNQVARYLQGVGYRIIPVNPGQSEILGEQCYPDLLSIPERIDLVDIFRSADQVEPIVRDAIQIRARVVWMQQGVVNQQAATIGEQAGLLVIMDRCIKVDHLQYGCE